jgi:hypothetical protein
LITLGCLVNRITFSKETIDFADLLDKYGTRLIFEFYLKQEVDRDDGRINDLGVGYMASQQEERERTTNEKIYTEINRFIEKLRDLKENHARDDTVSVDSDCEEFISDGSYYNQVMRKFGEERTLRYYLGQRGELIWPLVRLGFRANREDHHGKFYLLLAHTFWTLYDCGIEMYRGVITGMVQGQLGSEVIDEMLKSLGSQIGQLEQYANARQRLEQP